MTASEYQPPEWARGIKGLLRMLAYKLTFVIGLLSATLNALVFLFGPGMWRDGDIPNTFLGAISVIVAIVILSGVSLGCYFAIDRMANRWPGVNII